jgi:ABC-type sugar transport system ATPase subunit
VKPRLWLGRRPAVQPKQVPGRTETAETAERGLRLENVSKSFSDRLVLRNVDLDVRPREIHGLVGQNGSGKSTIIKILAGYHAPDEGSRAWMHGVPFELGSVLDGHRIGLRFVHQDLALILPMSAMDNVAMGGGYVRGPVAGINWEKQRELTQRALDRFGVNLPDLDAPLSSVAPVERTAVAIVRALAGWEEDDGVLVLDEPTASLPSSEVDRLHDIVRDVSSQGAGVIYVSHRLDDVLAVAHRISVLRDGVKVGTFERSELDAGQLARLMVGRRIVRSRRPPPMPEEREPVLRTEDLCARWLRGVDLEVYRGEVVGIAGVLGSGREELPYVLAASSSAPVTGRILLDGKELPPGSPRNAHRLGVAFLPADRIREASIGQLTMRENMTISGLDRISSASVINGREERTIVNFWTTRVDVVPKAPEQLLPTFSGGNQQKVILARLLSLSPRLLVLAEPTAGVDVGAREALYDVLRLEVIERKLTVIVASSDIQDLVALCQRIVVLNEGRVSCELAESEISESSILHAMEGLAPSEP